MAVVLELTVEEEERLRSKAAMAGVDQTEYVRRLLDEKCVREGEPPQSPEEVIEYWAREGLFGLFPGTTDSPELARELRQQFERRSW